VVTRPRRNLTPAQTGTGYNLHSLTKRAVVSGARVGANLMLTKLKASIEDIETWGRSRCQDAWIAMTGAGPGSRLSLSFLRKALMFEQRCKEVGGHSAAVRRQLRAGEEYEPAPTQALSPGTQLVREWNGRVYRVSVTAHGFEMDGQSYSSLSAIAKRITGAEWSGPRFFGLNRRKP